MRVLLLILVLAVSPLFGETRSASADFQFQAIKLGKTPNEQWDYSLTIENLYNGESQITGGERILYDLASLPDKNDLRYSGSKWNSEEAMKEHALFRVVYKTNWSYPMTFKTEFSSFKTNASLPQYTPFDDPNSEWTNMIPVDGVLGATFKYEYDDGTIQDGNPDSTITQFDSAGGESGKGTLNASLWAGSNASSIGADAVYTIYYSFCFGADYKKRWLNRYQGNDGTIHYYIPGQYEMAVRVIAECQV